MVIINDHIDCPQRNTAYEHGVFRYQLDSAPGLCSRTVFMLAVGGDHGSCLTPGLAFESNDHGASLVFLRTRGHAPAISTVIDRGFCRGSCSAGSE